MVRGSAGHVETLFRQAQQAVRDDPARPQTLRMLIELARSAPEDSEPWLYAHRHIAELVVDDDPWRASLLVRRVLRHWTTDDGAWAILALAQSLLGNVRYAAAAYREALQLCPDNPWYAHNLGHLLDVALDRPADGAVLLLEAARKLPEEPDVATSLAHALARAGDARRARDVLRRAVARGASAEQITLLRWLEAQDRPEEHPPGSTRRPAVPSDAPGPTPARRRTRKRKCTSTPGASSGRGKR